MHVTFRLQQMVVWILQALSSDVQCTCCGQELLSALAVIASRKEVKGSFFKKEGLLFVYSREVLLNILTSEFVTVS